MDEHLSDKKLISQYLSGKQEALQLLVSMHIKSVYNIALDYCKDTDAAEDITQETFIKVWKHISKFDQTKDFKPWLYQIARNTSLDYLRKRETVPFSAFEPQIIENIAKDISNPEYDYENRVLKLRLKDIMGKLSTQQLNLLMLKLDDNLTFKQIAEKNNEPLNSVKSRYLRTIGLIKKIFLA